MLSKDKTLILTFGAFALVMVGLAVVGGVLSYSPVPFWDMWGGYLGFFMRADDGDMVAWWDQANEHRIVLARLLFWVDLKWFGGASVFLIAANYFFVGISAFMFWRILRDAATTEKPATGEIVLGLFVTAWLFLWMQKENLTWSYQSQFILAQLLPLCALHWLNKSVVEIRAKRHFLVACGFGVASVGTMANGILALPLMAFYALLMRQGLIRVGILATLSVVMIFLYFHNYNAVSKHGSLSQALRENPSGFIQYVLLYLGSPFHYLSGQGKFSKLIAQVATLVLVGSSAWFAIKALRKPRERTLQVAMLFFILYIGGTAFGTAGGRLIFGVDQALSSRYTTPVLMAWSALLVIFSPSILVSIRKSAKFLLPFAVLGLLMFNLQRQALQSDDDELFERKIAALALELQIKDQIQVKHIYPFVDELMPTADMASARNLSIFGMYPFRDARGQLGTTVQPSNLPACIGNLDTVEQIDGDATVHSPLPFPRSEANLAANLADRVPAFPEGSERSRFVRVSGWVFSPIDKVQQQVVRFINSQNQVVGYALIGMPSLNIAIAIDGKALQPGYRGYLLSDQLGRVLTQQAESQAGPSCRMQVNVPASLNSNGFDDELLGLELVMADKCDGSIDSVNGTTPSQATFPNSAKLMVSGWLAVSVDKATLPEAIYVVLTDAQGNRKYLKTHVKTRPDVGAYFKKPELSRSGFSTIADISTLEGQYTLGLAIKEAGKIKLCPQFNIQATITK